MWHGAQYAKWLSIGRSGPNAEKDSLKCKLQFHSFEFQLQHVNAINLESFTLGPDRVN